MSNSKDHLGTVCIGLKLILSNRILTKTEKVRAANHASKLLGREKVASIIDEVRWEEEERVSSDLVRESEKYVQILKERPWVQEIFPEHV